VQEFRRWEEETAVTVFKVKVNGGLYCDIGFPEEEDYASVIDTCVCMVEADPDFANRHVISTYFNVEQDEINFHMTLLPDLSK